MFFVRKMSLERCKRMQIRKEWRSRKNWNSEKLVYARYLSRFWGVDAADNGPYKVWPTPDPPSKKQPRHLHSLWRITDCNEESNSMPSGQVSQQLPNKLCIPMTAAAMSKPHRVELLLTRVETENSQISQNDWQISQIQWRRNVKLRGTWRYEYRHYTNVGIHIKNSPLWKAPFFTLSEARSRPHQHRLLQAGTHVQ